MKLLESIKLGSKNLKYRMVMAPMTRSRADMNVFVSSSTKLFYT